MTHMHTHTHTHTYTYTYTLTCMPKQKSTHTKCTSWFKQKINFLEHLVWIHTPHCTTLHCIALQHTATQCNTMQHTATHCNTKKPCSIIQQNTQFSRAFCFYTRTTLHHIAPPCILLQHAALHCTTHQHTPTHSNTQETYGMIQLDTRFSSASHFYNGDADFRLHFRTLPLHTLPSLLYTVFVGT